MPIPVTSRQIRVIRHNKLRGFTLIELLIAISIVAIMATIGMVAYSQAQKSARDGVRKSDLDTISKMLATYQTVHGCLPHTTTSVQHYPGGPDSGNWDYSSQPVSSPTWLPFLASSGEAAPVDPINNMPDDNITGYGYRYHCYNAAASGCPANSVSLGAKLEANNSYYAAWTCKTGFTCKSTCP